MIVKINQSNNSWVHIGDVVRTKIYSLQDYILAFNTKRDYRIGGYKLDLYCKNEKGINRRSLHDFDELLFDKKIITNQIDNSKDILSDEDKNKQWSAKILEITTKTEKIIGVLMTSTTVYLLDDKGNTIEKLN